MRTPDAVPGLKLHDKAAYDINLKLAELTWLNYRYGVALEFEDEEEAFLGVFDQGIQNIRILPEKSAGAFSFFELIDAQVIDPEDPYHFQLDMVCTVWGNLDTIDATKDYDFSTDLIVQLMDKLTLAGAFVINYDIDPDYAWNSQYLMRPNWAVSVNFQYYLTKC